MEFRRRFEAIRRPFGFNFLHYLLIDFYHSHEATRALIQTYPIYSIFTRVQRKLSNDARQGEFVDVFLALLNDDERQLVETVEQVHSNVHKDPLGCLFRRYSPMHLLLFVEPAILFGDQRVLQLVRRVFLREFPKENCEFFHFAIALRKRPLIVELLSDSDFHGDRALNAKLNAPSDRFWLPIHYAAFVGDDELVRQICRDFAEQIDPMTFVLPKSRFRDFFSNPFDYLLRANGMKSKRTHGHLLSPQDDEDEAPILPILDENEDEEDDELLVGVAQSPSSPDQRKDERSDSFIADQQALQDADADVPDADQLESTLQFTRDSLLRSLVEQDTGLIYFVPSPLLLASACPFSEAKLDSYHRIIDDLLQSNLVDIDGLNHRVLTEKTLEYFSRHQFANFLRTDFSPSIFYQCDALFTSIGSNSKNDEPRISQFSEDDAGETLSKLIYFVTVLNQRAIVAENERFDELLLQHLLRLHTVQIEKALKKKLFLHQLTKRTLLEHEQLNQMAQRFLLRYEILDDGDRVEIDVNFFLLDSFVDQFADTYVAAFHTPITMLIVNGQTALIERFFAKLSAFKTNFWGILAMFEVEICFDHLFTRRGKTNIDAFRSFCQIIEKMPGEQKTIQQRIFVHAFATCVKHNAKTELDFLINTYARIFYESCEEHPMDIRHNILAYCVVRNQAFLLEDLISAFSTLNDDCSRLYAFPLSRLSNSTKFLLDETNRKGVSSPTTNFYSDLEGDYRQCRRIRNTTIAQQQKANPHHRFPHQENSQSMSHRAQPRMSRFWRTVRSLQMGLKNRNQTSQYVEQVNHSDLVDRSLLASTTIEPNENQFQRADLRLSEAAPTETPTLIKMFSTEQDDDQEDIPVRGQTLLHIAAKLPGHEDVVRVLLAEYSSLTSLINANGQIPLHCAIHGGSTLTAQLLIEANPRSLTMVDHQNSGAFHYCCENKNDVLLASILHVLRRLSSNQSIRVQALQNLIEPNADGRTPFSIACQNGALKCLKQIFDSKWLLKRVQLSDLLIADGIKICIDQDRIDIVQYLVGDLRRFRVLMGLLIDVVFTEPLRPTTDVVVGRRQYNILEYSILLKKSEFVQILVSVAVPRTIEQKANFDDHIAVVRSSDTVAPEASIHDEYKRFLTRYSFPFKHDLFNQTPIQRMLKIPALIPFVPNLLNQFVDDDGMDLSVIDDCLCSKLRSSRCIFGQKSRVERVDKEKSFSTTNWMKEHPLNLISQCEFAPIYDHPLVTTIVDSKADLFGNLLYLFILLIQAMYVVLYTSVALVTRTPKFYGQNYVEFENDSCFDMCQELTNGTAQFDYSAHHGTFFLYIFRFLLLVCSCLALFKEFLQVITQRGRYFKAIFLNLLEILAYSCALVFAIDLNSCSRYSSLRCKYQYDFGALGVASVWTVLLLVFVNSLKLGKYGLLFITVFLTFLKFCLIYIFIWLGYLFAFHMLLTENASFETVWTAIPRMVAMLTGEFNFENLFYPEGQPVRGSTMAKVIFTTFVFVVHICVMNILIGLAVSDVNDFQTNAKRENLRSRIRTVLNFQAKFGRICSTFARSMFFLGRRFPALLSGLKFDVSKLSIRIKPVLVATRTTNVIQCRVGYVSMKKSSDTIAMIVQSKEQSHETQNEKLLLKVNEIREEIDKTQLKFTQELHRLTINLSKLIEK